MPGPKTVRTSPRRAPSGLAPRCKARPWANPKPIARRMKSPPERLLDGDITHVLPLPVETAGTNVIDVEDGLEAIDVRVVEADLVGVLARAGPPTTDLAAAELENIEVGNFKLAFQQRRTAGPSFARKADEL